MKFKNRLRQREFQRKAERLAHIFDTNISLPTDKHLGFIFNTDSNETAVNIVTTLNTLFHEFKKEKRNAKVALCISSDVKIPSPGDTKVFIDQDITDEMLEILAIGAAKNVTPKIGASLGRLRNNPQRFP